MPGTSGDNTSGKPEDSSQSNLQDIASYIEQDTAALERIAKLPWGRADSERRVESRIRFEDPRLNISFEPLPSDPAAREQSVAGLTEFVTIETLKEIEASEQQILAWLARDPANPIRFFADPLGCLAEAGVRLSPRALSEIQQARQAQMASLDPNSLARVKHLKVELGPEAVGRKGCLRGLARTLLKRHV